MKDTITILRVLTHRATRAGALPGVQEGRRDCDFASEATHYTGEVEARKQICARRV